MTEASDNRNNDETTGTRLATIVTVGFLISTFGSNLFGSTTQITGHVGWYFRPEFPHAGYACGVVGYAFLAFVTAFLENAVSIPREVLYRSVSRDGKIRRLEESIKDWRGILFISATTYIVVMVYWLQMLWQVAGFVVTAPREKFLFGNAMVASVLIFSLCVVVGPIWTLFKGLKNHQLQLFVELEAAESLEQTSVQIGSVAASQKAPG